MLSSDIEFMALLPKYKDLEVVVPWIDRMYKAWKDTKHKDDCLVIAKELGVKLTGSKKDLISRIMTSSMYELLL
jgi:threonine synthase